MGVCNGKTQSLASPVQPRVTERSELSFPTRLGDVHKNYTFTKILGHGQFGTVREAVANSNSSVKFAIKSIPKERIRPSGFTFMSRELEVLQLVDHPNVIKCHEIYEDIQSVHIVMELCTGGDLFDHLERRGQYTEEETARIMAKIISAVNYLHGKNICHRDIKADNFLFESPDPQAEIKVIDFGLSRRFSADKMHTIVGTCYYMAPEVLRGEYGKECDIWSLGVLLYLMLTGKPPFFGATEDEVFRQVCAGKCRFEGEDWESKSEQVKDLISKMLTVDIEKRISLSSALRHDWFKLSSKSRAQSQVSTRVFEKLQKYRTPKKLKLEAMRVAVKLLSMEQLEELRTAFQNIDVNNCGTISAAELATAMKNGGFAMAQEEIESTRYTGVAAAGEIMKTGQLNYTEFLMATLDLKRVLTDEILLTAFRHFDVNDTGFITATDLSAAFQSAGYECGIAEISDIVRELGLRDDCKIGFDEFRTILRNHHTVQGETASPQVRLHKGSAPADFMRQSPQFSLPVSNQPFETTDTVRSYLTSRPASALVQGRKVSSQAVKVARRLDPDYPIPVFAAKPKSQRSTSAGLELPGKVGRAQKSLSRASRPLGGSETERAAHTDTKASVCKVQHTPKPGVPRVVPSYKPNKAESPPPQPARSPSPPTTHSSLKTLISETLRKEKEAKDKRTTAIIESIAQQETKKAKLKSCNQRIREENGKRFKVKSFKPVVAWGADERKVLGTEEEIIRKQAQADRERRRNRHAGSKHSLGLEVYHQVKSEVLQTQRVLRSSSSIPSPLPQEPKPVHTPDPYVQAYMHIKKRLHEQQEFKEALESQDAEARRILMLKQLEARERVQLERYKSRQQRHTKKKLKKRRRRRLKPWESSSIPPPSEPEDEEVKLIMGQIEEDQERDQPVEGRECRLFGIVEGTSQTSKLANATQIGNEVVERRSATPKVEVPRSSVSMPAIKPTTDSLPESRPSREAEAQRSSFSESESMGVPPEVQLRHEIQQKKEDIRRRLAELRSRVDRVREPAADDSYRHSIREETSEEHLGSSDDAEEFSEPLLEPMEAAQHYSDSLQGHTEDPPHFPGHISNIEAKQDVTPVPLKTRIFEPLIAQGFSRESKVEIADRLRSAKDEEIRQLQTIAAHFPMGERGVDDLMKNLEDRYQLLFHLLDASECEKKPDGEASDLLTSLTPPPQPPHPKVEFVATSPSPEEAEDKSIHSPELSEIEVDERRERDKTSEISGDLRSSFFDRPAMPEAAVIKEESNRPSSRSSFIEREDESPCGAEPAGPIAFSALAKPRDSEFEVEEPLKLVNPPILVEDWGGSSSPSLISGEESKEETEVVQTVPFFPPVSPIRPLPLSSMQPIQSRDDRAVHALSESLLEFLVWEVLHLPAMQTSVDSIVEDISRQIWAKLVAEIHVAEYHHTPLDIDQLAKAAFHEAMRSSSELQRNLETPLERNSLDLLLTLQETEVGQMILEEPFAPAILPGRVLTKLEKQFPCEEAEQPVLRLVVEGINECLNGFRVYGTKGVPQPWSKSSRLLSPSLPLSDLQAGVQRQMQAWLALKIGQLPTPDLHLPNGQIDEDQLQARREERLAHALMTDLREKEPIWTDYEAEETQVKLDLADMVLDHIITELFQVIGA